MASIINKLLKGSSPVRREEKDNEFGQKYNNGHASHNESFVVKSMVTSPTTSGGDVVNHTKVALSSKYIDDDDIVVISESSLQGSANEQQVPNNYFANSANNQSIRISKIKEESITLNKPKNVNPASQSIRISKNPDAEASFAITRVQDQSSIGMKKNTPAEQSFAITHIADEVDTPTKAKPVNDASASSEVTKAENYFKNSQNNESIRFVSLSRGEKSGKELASASFVVKRVEK